MQLAHEPTAPAFTSGRHQHQRPAAQLAAVIDHRMQPELLLEALRLQLGQTAESDDAKLRIVQPGILRRLLEPLLALLAKNLERASCCRLVPSRLAMAAPSLRATSM